GDAGEVVLLDLLAEGVEDELFEVTEEGVVDAAQAFAVGLVGEDGVEAFEVGGGGDLEAVCAVGGVVEAHGHASLPVAMAVSWSMPPRWLAARVIASTRSG